ncbi:MAG TPA: hypothetical protein DD645_00220 [Olsenella sp.]|nr:hypothetical protein [Olsenella sp.]
MGMHWNAGGDVVTAAVVPYSHMDEEDSGLFYDTMNALLVYANRRLRVVREDELRERPGAPHMLYEHGGQVAEALWRHRSLVDDFVLENPAGLDEEHLACARPWRHALRDTFTCVGANADAAAYMNRDAVFVVGAMQDDADAHVHAIPSLMLLTLLPFKGGIVTDGKTLHISQSPASWAVPLMAQRARELAGSRLVSTAGQLLDYVRRTEGGGSRVNRRIQRAVDRGFADGTLL